jgi:hypothetical protein
MKTLRIAAPWLVGALIVLLLLQRGDPRATLAVLTSGELVRHVPIAAGFGLIWLALDAAGLAWLFSRGAAPIRWRDMAALRARSYPPMALSFHLGSAALAVLLQHATRAPLARITSALLLHYLVDLAALAAVALAGSLALDAAGAGWLRAGLATLALGLAAALLGCRLARRHLPGAAAALGSLSASELARLGLLRAAFHASFAVFVWLTLPAFGIGLALGDVLARMPLVLAGGALPFTPAGLGTTQAAFVFLFRDLASEPALLAYAIAYGATLLALRLAIGFTAWLLAGSRRLEGVLA